MCGVGWCSYLDCYRRSSTLRGRSARLAWTRRHKKGRQGRKMDSRQEHGIKAKRTRKPFHDSTVTCRGSQITSFQHLCRPKKRTKAATNRGSISREHVTWCGDLLEGNLGRRLMCRFSCQRPPPCQCCNAKTNIFLLAVFP